MAGGSVSASNDGGGLRRSVSAVWQTVIEGLAIVWAVVADRFQQRLPQPIALRRRAALGR